VNLTARFDFKFDLGHAEFETVAFILPFAPGQVNFYLLVDLLK